MLGVCTPNTLQKGCDYLAKRTNRIQVWLNDKELEILNKRMESTGMCREGYLRHLIIGIVPIERPSTELLDYIKELRLIGNNINQIAMRLNATNTLDALQYRKNFEWLQDVVSRASSGKVGWQ